MNTMNASLAKLQALQATLREVTEKDVNEIYDALPIPQALLAVPLFGHPDRLLVYNGSGGFQVTERLPVTQRHPWKVQGIEPWQVYLSLPALLAKIAVLFDAEEIEHQRAAQQAAERAAALRKVLGVP